MVAENRVLVGVVGAPHGVRGEMRIKSYTADPATLAQYRHLTSEDGRRSFEIRGWRPLKDDMGVARLVGIEDRDAAAALTNQRLYVERDKLPPPEDDEFYYSDLIGLRAETAAGIVVGNVTALQNFGAGDLLEIKPPEGQTLLIAFTKGFVPLVDVSGGRVVVAEEALTINEPADEDEP